MRVHHTPFGGGGSTGRREDQLAVSSEYSLKGDADTLQVSQIERSVRARRHMNAGICNERKSGSMLYIDSLNSSIFLPMTSDAGFLPSDFASSIDSTSSSFKMRMSFCCSTH